MKNVLVVLFLCLTTFAMAQNEENRGYRVNVGEMPPNLDFYTLEGKHLTNENLKGKVVVLQFTASWCSVCRKEMPHLEKEVWQRFKNDDFLLIGVDLMEEQDKVWRFIDDMQVTYPFTVDEEGELFKAFTLPNAGVTRNIVLDKTGKIVFLTRLYNEKEFGAMIEVIAKELKK